MLLQFLLLLKWLLQSVLLHLLAALRLLLLLQFLPPAQLLYWLLHLRRRHLALALL